MNKDLMKLKQNRDAHKIKDYLIRISHTKKLPENYHPADFRIVEDYIEYADEYSDSKIEIKKRYLISPTIIQKPGIGSKKGKSNLLATKGWMLEELLRKASDFEEPTRVDYKTIGKFSAVDEIVRMILLNDAATLIDSAIYFERESEAALAIEEEWKNVLS